MPVTRVRTMGWTRASITGTVLRALEQQRKEQGDRVRDLRAAHGWTVEQLAHEAGVSAKTISRLQKGATDPRRSTIRKIARALGVDEAEILGPPLAIQATQLDRIETKIDELRQHFGLENDPYGAAA